MKLSLSVKDRLSFNALYPERSNLIEQIVVKDISEKVTIKQSEIKEFGIISVENEKGEKQIRWDNEKAKDIEVEFTNAETKLMQERIITLDKEKKITQDILPLCLKIKDLKNG